MKQSALFLFILFVLFTLQPAYLYSAACTIAVLEGEVIQDAIDIAGLGAVICIEPGTYEEKIVLKDNISIHGDELARTIIDGNTAVTVVKGAESAAIDNITISGGAFGLEVTDITFMTVNNVIIVDNSNAGVSCANSTFTVENSVIDNNGTGIDCDTASTVTLTNVIISNNIADLGPDTSLDPVSTSNLFHNAAVPNDPLFVNASANDYHLQSTSPAIDAGSGTDPDGTQADIGAYGGPGMDTAPFPVLTLSAAEGTNGSIALNWTANKAYNVSGYTIYFDSDTSGPPYTGTANEGTSPITVSGAATSSFTLTGLAGDPIAAAPSGLSTTPGNLKLYCSWNKFDGASGYILYYGTSSGNYTESVDVGDATRYVIENLKNNVTYYIAVSAYYQPTFYMAVSVFDTSGNNSVLGNEVSVTLAGKTEGPKSPEVSDFPERTVPFPNLEDERKCFIATAVYGSSMEPQVVLLRKFRNHFLLTNSLGRKIVAAYYRISPPLADYLRDKERLRPFARTALLPFIGIAGFCLNTSILQKLLTFFVISALFTGLFLLRKRELN